MFRRASFVVPPPFFVILGPAFLVISFWESFDSSGLRSSSFCLWSLLSCTSVFVVFS